MLAFSNMLIFLGAMSFYLLQIDLTNDKRLAAQKGELGSSIWDRRNAPEHNSIHVTQPCSSGEQQWMSGECSAMQAGCQSNVLS